MPNENSWNSVRDCVLNNNLVPAANFRNNIAYPPVPGFRVFLADAKRHFYIVFLCRNELKPRVNTLEGISDDTKSFTCFERLLVGHHPREMGLDYPNGIISQIFTFEAKELQLHIAVQKVVAASLDASQ